MTDRAEALSSRVFLLSVAVGWCATAGALAFVGLLPSVPGALSLAMVTTLLAAAPAVVVIGRRRSAGARVMAGLRERLGGELRLPTWSEPLASPGLNVDGVRIRWRIPAEDRPAELVIRTPDPTPWRLVVSPAAWAPGTDLPALAVEGRLAWHTDAPDAVRALADSPSVRLGAERLTGGGGAQTVLQLGPDGASLTVRSPPLDPDAWAAWVRDLRAFAALATAPAPAASER